MNITRSLHVVRTVGASIEQMVLEIGFEHATVILKQMAEAVRASAEANHAWDEALYERISRASYIDFTRKPVPITDPQNAEGA